MLGLFTVNWNLYQPYFEPDYGMLCDIYVLGVDRGDWQHVLDFLGSHAYPFHYTVNGDSQVLPSQVDEIFATRIDATCLLTIKVGAIRIACHFFDDDYLELDFLPDDVTDAANLDDLSEFVQRIGTLLNRSVYLAGENSSRNYGSDGTAGDWFAHFNPKQGFVSR